MSVALKELLRTPRRFVPVWVALTLLVILLIVLGGFLDGLELSQTGPYRAYSGSVFVTDKEANLQLQRSNVASDALDGVKSVGDIGSLDLTFTVAATGNSANATDDDLYDIGLIGYDISTGVLPDAPSAGEAIVDRQLQREAGVDKGDTITVGPSGEPLKVAEIVDDLTVGAPTVWVNPDEWRRLATTINPAGLPPEGTHQALIVKPSGTDADAVKQIDGVDGVTAATSDEMIKALTVVQSQSSTFTAIILVTFIVSLLVTALFFALITLEQTRLYAVLKALGARTGELLRGISFQAFVIAIAALIVGIAISAILLLFIPPQLPIRVLPIRVVQISIGLLVTALVGALLTARRILKIDPATAIG